MTNTSHSGTSDRSPVIRLTAFDAQTPGLQPMPCLFLKIFLWFWMAFVIVGVTLAAVVAITRSNETMLARVSLYLPFEARTAAEVYEREGKTGLKYHFARIIDGGSAEPHLLDENWIDVLGRDPSPQAVEFAKAAREDAPLISKFTGWNGFAAQQAIGPSGHGYTMVVVFSSRSFVGLIRELGFKTLFGLLAILLVGGPFCYLLARHIANPIVQLSEAAGRIADGWLDTRSDRSIRLRRDEIGHLGVSFDRMAERIESLVH
jgi:two-component system, OmpR family, sensor histidine kinase CpxA